MGNTINNDFDENGKSTAPELAIHLASHLQYAVFSNYFQDVQKVIDLLIPINHSAAIDLMEGINKIEKGLSKLSKHHNKK